jgi:hypothetical protein
MKVNVKSLIAVAILAAASVSAHAVTTPHSNTLRVESPATDPTLEQPGAEAMYLYYNDDGQALLYVEADHGRELTTLNVTDPAAIRRVAKTELPVPSGYDFVRAIGDHDVLIRYRKSGEVAALCLKHDKHPALKSVSALENASVQQALGETGLLISKEHTIPGALRDPQSYEVVDTASATHPVVLASVAQVTERVSNPDTGTLFLLNGNGVTVVRRLRIEADHQMDLDLERP